MGIRNWLIDRLSTKESQTSRVIMAGRDETIWSERNYENFAKETYMKNLIAFKCIDYVAKSVASVAWGMYSENADSEVTKLTTHPINALLKRPNPDDSFGFLILKAMAFYLIAGNVYFEGIGPLSGRNKGVPQELHILRPDRMKIIADKVTGRIKQYVYEVNGHKVYFDVDIITGNSPILHLKTFHPLDDWYGAAITESAAREIDTSNEATEWNKKILENGGSPGMIISVSGNMTDQQWERIEKQLKKSYAGASNAKKTMLIESDGAANVHKTAWTPAELDFIEGNREMARKISYGFGVPSMLIGIPGDNTYSNFKEARLAFWEDTVIPYLTYLKGELNNWIFGTDSTGAFLNFDLNDVPALEPRRAERWEKATKATFLTENEKRQMVGFEAKEGLDIILVSSSMTTLEDLLTEPEEVDEQDFEEEDKEIEKLIRQGYTKEEAKKIITGENL